MYIMYTYLFNLYINGITIGSRWRVKDLTYKVSKYPKLIGKAETDAEIRKAFNVWSDVTPLTFTHKKSGQVRFLKF